MVALDVIQIGFDALGFVAGFHARALQSVRGCELGGIVNRTGAEEFVALAESLEIGTPVVYDSLAEMAQHVDVVSIVSPNFARVDAVRAVNQAVQNSKRLKGIMVEKPLARNCAEAAEIMALVAQMAAQGVYTHHLENQDFMPSVEACLEQLATCQAAMGPIYYAFGAEEHPGPHKPWFWDPTQQGGGVLLDMGCHSIEATRHILTPLGKPADFLKPVSVSATTNLLKWGQEKWRAQRMAESGVDYAKTPAEDLASAVVMYRNPETGQVVRGEIKVSWCFEIKGLRLSFEALGPGYGMNVNTLNSPARIFIGDEAAVAIVDQEKALEKSTASRGDLTILAEEPSVYGYVNEYRHGLTAFRNRRDGLPWAQGAETVRLLMAAYMSAERGCTIDLTDPIMLKELETFVPLIQQGKGAEVLYK